MEEGKMAKGNGDLVEKAVRVAHDLGRQVATTAEARAQLGLDATPRPAPSRTRASS
ncbi:MAG TPA: 3-keto-5-aminohexanoate cleavage protein [Candidatus Dormibacteraeota bacterium]|nr:3-keto-5-aminohexanoate cleavage protein [Candidatus Dormibacteraeota bacterium]